MLIPCYWSYTLQLLKIAFGDPDPAKSNLASYLGLKQGDLFRVHFELWEYGMCSHKISLGKRLPAHKMVDMRDASPSCKGNLPSFLLELVFCKPVAHFFKGFPKNCPMTHRILWVLWKVVEVYTDDPRGNTVDRFVKIWPDSRFQLQKNLGSH